MALFGSGRRRPSPVVGPADSSATDPRIERPWESPDPATMPAVRNLVACPRLGKATLQGVQVNDPGGYVTGAVYVHVHARQVPGTEGSTALHIEGTGTDTDTHVAPGGRHGGLRLGMRPGQIYTCSVDVTLDRRLAGALAPSRLSIAPGCVVDGATRWAYSSSNRAPNEPGRYRLHTTFRVPADATEAWVRLIGGMTAKAGSVAWDRFQLTPALQDVGYFDGDTPADRWYEYNWLGKPGASESVRTMRDPAKSWPELDKADPDPAAPGEILGEIEVRAERLLVGEAERLLGLLTSVATHRHQDLVQAATLLIDEARNRIDFLVGNDLGEPPAKVRNKSTARIAGLVETTGSPAVASLAGKRLIRNGSWEAAVSTLRIATQSQAEPMDNYRLAFALERLGRREEIGRLVRETADRQQRAPFDVRKAAAIDVNRFAPRYEVGAFLADHLDDIQERADRASDLFTGGLGEFPVFSYWGQGYDQAPPVVLACRRALERHNPAAQLHFLDDATLPYYAEFPDTLLKASRDQPALFSDALRVELLARYGGIWLDATCLTTAPLTESVQNLVGSGFFAFNYVESRISSWFMLAGRESRVVALLRAALLTWFEYGQQLVDYYLIHHIFEMLYRLDDRFAAEWDSGRRLSSRPPHELQLVMYDEADPVKLRELLASSFVHKLTHKLNRQYRAGHISPHSYLAAIVRGAG
jgi:hypothetical protein